MNSATGALAKECGHFTGVDSVSGLSVLHGARVGGLGNPDLLAHCGTNSGVF